MTEDVAATQAPDVHTLKSGSPSDKSIACFDFAVSVNNHEFLVVEIMSSKVRTA